MFYIGFCPVCGEGLLGIRVCAGQGHGVVLCDECDAIWKTIELVEPTFSSDPDLRCPECGADLAQPPARWATRDEIEQLGWGDAIIGEGWALGDASAEDGDL